MTTTTKYLSLIGINLIYACTSLCTKYASQQAFLSWKYFIGLCGAIGVMGVYAVLWQQILKRMSIGDAYMFKGMSLVFILLFSVLLLGEGITACNVIGSCIIITGITLYSWVERKDAHQ